jgi:sugar phosphate isomerase/epimerase
MQLMGIGDEAANSIDGQIHATRTLGWKEIEMRGVEVPGFPKANFHEIPDAAFDIAVQRLEEADLHVYCFGSTIMNWSRKWSDPFHLTLAEVQRVIPRMQRLKTQFIRIMSFKPDDDQDVIPPEVFHRVREVTNMFIDAGIQPLHENCMNHGGMSWRHAIQLLDNCPGLQWVFDTANPAFNPDRSKTKPWPRQDPLEFWTHIRDRVAHIHIKDATWNPAKNDADYNWPGEGEGCISEILTDAFSRGYDAGISIEPHMVVVFHDASAQARPNESAMQENFIEYGRRTQHLITRLKSELAKTKTAQPAAVS